MTKDLPPSRTAEQFVVRFPEGMRDRITEAAKKNNRSMNAEIVARLEQSFSAAADSDSQHALEIARVALQKIDDRLAVLERQIGRGKVGPKKPEQLSQR